MNIPHMKAVLHKIASTFICVEFKILLQTKKMIKLIRHVWYKIYYWRKSTWTSFHMKGKAFEGRWEAGTFTYRRSQVSSPVAINASHYLRCYREFYRRNAYISLSY